MKVLYNQNTQSVIDYPRKDQQEIVGLSSEYLVLGQVETVPPSITENQSLLSSYVVDVNNLEYRQEWEVMNNPVHPNWLQFYKALKVSLTFAQLMNLTVIAPNISGVMAAMGIAIQDGIRDPSDPDILPAFQASVDGVIAALNAINQPLNNEQLTEVRTLLDDNGFNNIQLGG